VKILVGGGLLVFLLLRIGLPGIIEALRVRPSLLAVALAILVATHVLHAGGLWLMVREEAAVPFGALFTMGCAPGCGG
jgi:hypothetical protein